LIVGPAVIEVDLIDDVDVVDHIHDEAISAMRYTLAD
jgi:hypothetical protein